MYQVITSPIVAAPAGSYILKMLHNNKLLYVPANGHKTTNEVSDTKEDMMEIFHTDASGTSRELKKLMGRRNYVAVVAYDPESLAAGGNGQSNGQAVNPSAMSMIQGAGGGGGYAQSVHSGGSNSNSNQGSLSKLSLAVDFVVQGDGSFTTPTKYGPVIVPHLEFGH